MPYANTGYRGPVQHAAMWLLGPDMPGLLNLGSRWVAERGGNIEKNIADKFGEKCVVFMSISANPEAIRRMDAEKENLKKASGCGVVFQPMKDPTVPEGFQEELHGFDILTDDAIGLIAEITELLAESGLLVVGHTGERRVVPGPNPLVQSGQKFVVMLPHDFDHPGFTRALSGVVRKYNGTIKTPLRAVPGLLWWW
jgi:glycine cleavage system regulatory protein